MALRSAVSDTANEAIGRRRRADPIVGSTGGPAGNARITAWTGVILLALVLAELITLFDVDGLIGWHVVLGTLLVPPALVKTGSTSWRIVRYYTGNRSYKSAGPPPMPLRLLGPLVVVTTLGLLGSGLALLALGPQAGRRPFVTVAGFGLDTVTLHQATFIGFAVAAGLHVIARIVPAANLVCGRVQRAVQVPGGRGRGLILLSTLAAAAVAAALVLGSAAAWHHGDHGFPHHLRSIQSNN